jgi:nicotinate-nucleotide adenylyltransferase
MKKIGLYFGSFNPVHIGHMIIANHIVNYSDLDEVWMVVTPQNPFKKKNTLLNDRTRYNLVDMAIDDNLKLKVTDIEFGLPQPSYTVNTLAYIQEKYPKKEFALIMGSDNLDTFHKWKNYEQIIKNHNLYVYPRPNSTGGQFKDHPKVTWVDAPLMEISSTHIRKAIAAGKSIKYLLPENVHDYILEMNYYK